MQIKESAENYLETILVLQEKQGHVRLLTSLMNLILRNQVLVLQ